MMICALVEWNGGLHHEGKDGEGGEERGEEKPTFLSHFLKIPIFDSHRIEVIPISKVPRRTEQEGRVERESMKSTEDRGENMLKSILS